FDHCKVDIPDAIPTALFTPDVRGAADIGEKVDPVNHENRFTLHAYVIRMTKIADHVEDDCPIVIIRMLLSNEDFLIEAIPRACPIFIRPGNAERKAWFVCFYQSVER